jgi:hypothetical protein
MARDGHLITRRASNACRFPWRPTAVQISQPALAQVLERNRLPLASSLPIGEMKMLERKELVPFYLELQTASRIQAKTGKVKSEENAEFQLTQS